MPRSRSRGPATSSATASSPSCPLSGPSPAVLRDMDVDLARHQWQDGIRRVEGMRADRGRYADRMAQVDVLVNALRQRVGQVFTLEELARVVRRRRRLGTARCSTTRTRGSPGERGRHGCRRRVPSLRPRRDGLPAVKRVVLLRRGCSPRVRRRRRGRRGAQRQPEAGRHPVARSDAAAAAARPGRARNGHRYRPKPINLFRKRKLWLRLAGDRSCRDEL